MGLLLTAAMPAAADPLSDDARVVMISPGSNLFLQAVQPADGIFSVVSMGQEPDRPTSRFEQQALASLPSDNGEAIGLVRADAPTDPALPDVPPIAPDQVRLALKLTPDRRGTILLIQNSYPRAIHFKVSFSMPDGRPAPPQQQTICPVAAGKRSMEHWKLPIRFLAIRNLAFVDDDTSKWRCF